MNKILCFLIFVQISFSIVAQDKPDSFAVLSGKGLDTTTGGEGGEKVTVSNFADLKKYAESVTPYIILVEGTIEQPNFTEIDIASHKTIVGIGDSATLVNIELHLINVKNIIIRNLTVRDNGWAEMSDCDGLQADACHHIWIDHCHFSHCFDGLIDLRFECDYVTVSWTHLSNHNKAFGIGWTDQMDYRIGIHHCWFDNTWRRNPSFGNGYGHLYNNYLSNIDAYGNLARGIAKVIIENSFYENASSPVSVDDEAELFSSNNLFENCYGSQSGNVSEMPYDLLSYYNYTLDPVEEVRTIAATGAGPHAFIGKQYTNSPIVNYTVSASTTSPYGSLQPEVTTVEEGGRVTITAIPVDGYQFDHWNIDQFGDTNPATIIVSDSMNLIAHFRVAQYELVTSVEGKGTVDPKGSIYQIGEEVTIKATPDEGWVFDHWEGDLEGQENPTSIQITKNTTVKACFRQIWGTITTKVQGKGTVDPPNGQYDIGQQAIITAIPNDNWIFDHWEGGLSGNTNPETITFSEDLTITAVFKQVRGSVNTRILKGKGAIIPDNQDFDIGAEISVTAIPDEGWIFERWSGYYRGTANPLIFTLENDVNLYAYFMEDTTSTSVNLIRQKQLIRYYCNNEQKELILAADHIQDLHVRIYNLNGQILISTKINLLNTKEISLNNLHKGIYLIRFDYNGRVESGRITLL